MGYNLLTGAGFDMSIGGSWGMAWIGLVILTFIIMFARKWLYEEGGLPFNWIFASAGAGLGYLITISIMGDFKWAFLAGFLGLVILGFGAGYFVDGGEVY